jgi:hypothetical protein
MSILIIEQTVAYMLKVLKSETKIILHKNEFNAIRHGDYFEFINLIKEPIPFIAIWKDGKPNIEHHAKEDDIDIVGLIKAAPSLKKFHKSCKISYGNMNDPDLSDKDYYNAVAFEIALRMHAKNKYHLEERYTLEKVIDKLCEFSNIPELERNQLHQGRKFINMIKQHKRHFKTWQEGLTEFNKAFEIILKYKWTIV